MEEHKTSADVYYTFWWVFFLHEFIQTHYEALQAFSILSNLGQNATAYRFLLDREESPQCETAWKCPLQTHTYQAQVCRLKQGEHKHFLTG